MAEWLGRRTCNLVVLGSSPPCCYSLDLFLVAPSLTPWLHFVNSCLQKGWWNKGAKLHVTTPKDIVSSFQVMVLGPQGFREIRENISVRRGLGMGVL